MAYIGKNLVGILKETKTVTTMTGDGSDTTLTLTDWPGSVNNVLVFFDGIRQTPVTDYTVMGTALTFTTAPETGVAVVAIVGNHSGIEPKKHSVTSTKIVAMNVTDAKITGMAASKLTGALPAISGAALTNTVSSTGIDNVSADPLVNANPASGVGTIQLNQVSGEMFLCTDATAGANVWNNVGLGIGHVAKPFGGLGGGTVSGYSAGGAAPVQDTIEKFSFASSIVVADHGNMFMARDGAGSNSSATDGYIHGGYISGPAGGVGGFRDNIDRFSFATNSTAADHGNMTVARVGTVGCSSSTNGYIIGGHLGPSNQQQNVIDTFTFGSNSNATLHTDMSDPGRARCAGQSSNTDGYATGGEGTGGADRKNTMDKFSFSSNVTATDHGDMVVARNYPCGISSTTHGYTCAGETAPGAAGPSDIIERFSFGSGVNATDHGDCSVQRAAPGGSSSTTHGFVIAGYSAGAPSKSIDKFSFASNITATDHGDLAASESGNTGFQV